jgi:NAD(P)-dependent dehydrogenase (short-subunit alcohol dehydrogenase family)
MSKKVALITGGSSGIGRVAVLRLLDLGWHVVVAGRSDPRLSELELSKDPHSNALENLSFLPLNLADLDSVQDCAQAFLSMNLPLDALILNAGLAGKLGETKQGFELAYGVNHLGHFLLTQWLLEKLRQSAPSRVVTVASRAHHFARNGIKWSQLHKPSQSWLGIKDYAASKLANIWFSRVLAKKLEVDKVSCFSLHPGVVRTGIWRYAPAWVRPVLGLRSMLTPEEGAMTTMHCILHAPAQETGLYYANCQPTDPSSIALNDAEAEKLWMESLNHCSQWLPEHHFSGRTASV